MSAGPLAQLGAGQALVLGSPLLLSGLAKIRIGTQPPRVTRLAVSPLLGRLGLAPSYQARAWQTLGAIELLLAGLFLTSHFLATAGIAAMCVFGTGLCYLLWALRHTPDRPCGCLSAKGRITRYTVCRCCVLLASSIFVLRAGVAWWSALGYSRLVGGVISAELAVLVALSAGELRNAIRIGRRRTRHFGLGVRGLLCSLTADRYLRTKACPAIGLDGVLPSSGRPTDRWRDGCFYFVAYEPTSRERGHTLVAVFHLPGSPYLRRLVAIDHAIPQTTVLFDTADAGERLPGTSENTQELPSAKIDLDTAK